MKSFALYRKTFEEAVQEGAKFAERIYEPQRTSTVKTAIRIHLLTLGYSTHIAEKSANFIINGK